MSLCTLIPNQEKIKQYYQEIDDISKNFDSGWRVVDYILQTLLLEQWKLRLYYYNKKMLDKHRFEITVNGKNYLNCLFQHIYNHNHNTIMDECYEVLEAEDKYYCGNKEGNVVQKDKDALSLWVEELIDALFFTMEQTVFYETHYLLMLTDYNFNSQNIYKYLTLDKDEATEESVFNNRLKTMIEAESSHLTTWFYENKTEIKKQNSYNIYDLLKANRECLRQVRWKDWQDFSDNDYSPTRFGNMFKANRDLYISLLNMLYSKLYDYIDLLDIKDYDAEHHISNMFKVIYALYMTKRDVNIQRQINDPRYNNNIIGEKVVQGVNV